MAPLRVILIAAGSTAGLYGATLAWELPPRTLLLIAAWAAIGVILHDFVLAPLCAALGWAGRRIIRGRWWTPVVLASLCSAVLLVLALPVYGRPGAKPDNMTLLDRDYSTGLWLSLAAVWLCVPIYYVVAISVSRLQLPWRRTERT
ncbi:hypothetical protein ACN27E_04900 [Mycobacterium sp. WMMD1722]|uniref:hypothetical protein n=1 Tax=Mycobacterium sp. WMMD1722 TaxID=3404117 RepID=UPI003BF50B4E